MRDKLQAIIDRKGGLEDASGRLILLDAWNEIREQEDRWRGVMSYVNATYERKIMGALFKEARPEREADGRPKFQVWLYQSDADTVRMCSRVSYSKQIARLQDAAAGSAPSSKKERAACRNHRWAHRGRLPAVFLLRVTLKFFRSGLTFW